MSAWYLMSALGLYAVDPVSARYVFGSPLFDRAQLQVAPGRELTWYGPSLATARSHLLQQIRPA